MTNQSHIRRSLAGGLLIVAASFPAAAHARLNLEPGGARPVSTTVRTAPAQRSVPRSAPTSAQPGFHWADAGIGAAGTVLLLGTGAVAYSAPRRRRGHRAIAG
jgi:hypothetical protein